MAEQENVFANSTINIDGEQVARVTSVRRSVSMNEVDTTGAENVSGTLADKQYVPVSIDPAVFDDWDEIERFRVGSYRLIAPKKLVASLDE